MPVTAGAGSDPGQGPGVPTWSPRCTAGTQPLDACGRPVANTRHRTRAPAGSGMRGEGAPGSVSGMTPSAGTRVSSAITLSGCSMCTPGTLGCVCGFAVCFHSPHVERHPHTHAARQECPVSDLHVSPACRSVQPAPAHRDTPGLLGRSQCPLLHRCYS